MYRISRFSKIRDNFDSLEDKLARLERKHPIIMKGINGDLESDAQKEIFETKKTNGPKSKKAENRGVLLDTATGATVGAALGRISKGSKKGTGKRALAGAAIGSGLGYSTGWVLSKANHKAALSEISDKIYKRDRWLDNMKVADGEMSEEEFDKKWKSKK